MFTIEICPNAVTKIYALYTLHKKNGELYHIGVCKLGDLFNTPDARRIPAYDKDCTYDLRLVSLHNNRGEAVIAESTERKKILPIIPRLTLDKVRGDTMVILCNQTGRVYRTISDLCRDRGCFNSSISNHLNNVPGFKSVQGYTYKRIPCNNGMIVARLRKGEAVNVAELSQPNTLPIPIPLKNN